MAGIKIHNYPIERTSFGDDDYYDIDYWTGTAYETAKIKGSVLKSALGYSFIDIATIISGYTLSANDAGKVITNSNTGVVRSLVVNNTLSGAGNSFHVKGRVAIQPLTGVNIDLPDGTTITEPAQYTCEADTHYVLHRKASTGNDWVLSAINSETLSNLGSKDLAQLDLIREYQVFEDGTLKFVTNDAGNDAKFQIGENSAERFGEIELNCQVLTQNVSLQDLENNAQGIVTTVTAAEFDVDSRSDITDPLTRRNRLYFSPQQTLVEHSNFGRIVFREIPLDGENIFEDLSPTKKGLQYNADYSADYTDRSLVDKAYVVANSGAQIYNGTDVSPLTKRNKLRFSGYLEAVDDAGDEETQVDLSSTALKESNVLRFGINGSNEVDLKITENTILTGDSNGFATTLTGTEGSLIGFGASNEVQEFEAVEVYNILKEENITADKTLALLDINGNSANVKAKFEISAIAVQNTTANEVTINIGSTDSGTDVVNAFALGASETKKLPLGTTFFSTTSGQNLFISSALWNSASVNIHVTISKIWQ